MGRNLVDRNCLAISCFFIDNYDPEYSYFLWNASKKNCSNASFLLNFRSTPLESKRNLNPAKVKSD